MYRETICRKLISVSNNRTLQTIHDNRENTVLYRIQRTINTSTLIQQCRFVWGVTVVAVGSREE